MSLLSQLNNCSDEKLKTELKTQFLSQLTPDSKEPVAIDTILCQLDGIYEDENRIIIATTNNIGDIPAPLLRPGRFDIKLELGNFIKSEICELLEKIFHPSDEDINWLRSQTFPENMWSPVEIINRATIAGELRDTVKILQNVNILRVTKKD